MIVKIQSVLHLKVRPWKSSGILSECIFERLVAFEQVVFTNESNIDRWKNSRQKAIDSKIGRLEGFMNVVNVPMQVYFLLVW